MVEEFLFSTPSRETYSFSNPPTLDYPTNRKKRAISIILFEDALRAVSGVTYGTLDAVMVGSADVMGCFSFIELSLLKVTALSMKKHDKKGPTVRL